MWSNILTIFVTLYSASLIAAESCSHADTSLLQIKDALAKIEPPKCMSSNEYENQVYELCDSIRNKHLTVAMEKFKTISCIVKSDSKELQKVKIQNTWSKYSRNIKCEDEIYEDLDVVSFSVRQNYPDFFKGLASIQNVDINARGTDGKTVLDFIQSEIIKYKERSKSDTSKISESEEKRLTALFNELRLNFKAKLSNEI